VPEADALVALLLGRIEGAESALWFKLELESEGILYYSSSSSSSSSSSLLELLAKESSDSNSLLDNPKSRKLNKILSIVRING
jgi:sulfur transfer protein SufE